MLARLNAEHHITIGEDRRYRIYYGYIRSEIVNEVDQWAHTSSRQCLAEENNVWSNVVVLVTHHLARSTQTLQGRSANTTALPSALTV